MRSHNDSVQASAAQVDLMRRRVLSAARRAYLPANIVSAVVAIVGFVATVAGIVIAFQDGDTSVIEHPGMVGAIVAAASFLTTIVALAVFQAVAAVGRYIRYQAIRDAVTVSG